MESETSKPNKTSEVLQPSGWQLVSSVSHLQVRNVTDEIDEAAKQERGGMPWEVWNRHPRKADGPKWSGPIGPLL